MIQDRVLATAHYHANESRYAFEHHSLSKLIRATRAAEDSGFSIADAAIDELNDLSWVSDIGCRWLSHHSTRHVTSPIFPGSPADGGGDVIKTGLVHRTSSTAKAARIAEDANRNGNGGDAPNRNANAVDGGDIME
jgi:hypothetical protein